jgi:hypothetical protein
MQIELSMNDVDIEMSRSLHDMKTTLVTKLNDAVHHGIEQQLLRQVSMHLFGTEDVEMVRDCFEIIRNDPEVKEKIVALRAARRIGAK